jgi:hypothetical protein
MNSIKHSSLLILSKYRTELMGFSILIIMFFHSFCNIDKNPISRLFLKGDIGVEFFLILSAIGIYSSLNKSSNLSLFYRKRFLRIIPTSLIIAIPIYIYIGITERNNIYRIILDISTFSCILGQIKYWFIHIILLLYIISPFYLKNKIHTRLMIPILLLIAFYILSLITPTYNIVLLRIPVYFLGFHIAYKIYEQKKSYALTHRINILIFILSWGLLYFLSYTEYNICIYRIIYFFISVPMLFSLGYIFQFMPNIILKFLSFMGMHTLELYMVHESIGLVIGQKFCGYNSYMSIIVSFVIAIPLAYTLKRVLTHITQTIKHTNSWYYN